MKKPDWDALEQIGAELTAALDQGALSRDVFVALWRRGVQAAAGHEEFLEFLANHAEPAWLDEIDDVAAE